MNDRELLKLAARAAQTDIEWCFGEEVPRLRLADPDWVLWPRWNPLTDDGDALRLAVKLRMYVGQGFETAFADVDIEKEDPDESRKCLVQAAYADHEGDAAKSTRYAITNAAAVIELSK